MGENGLKVGKVYDNVVINGTAIAKGFYLGKKKGQGLLYHHLIAVKNTGVGVGFNIYKFENYKLNEGSLEIDGAKDNRLSKSEREYLEQRLKKAGF